ncbi:hypothetical protein KGY64_05875 [Candidatus Bipolaricaulota bacterium]|nr:hypothetical protein [Candidatus Bipolaricaulota bacterium]
MSIIDFFRNFFAGDPTPEDDRRLFEEKVRGFYRRIKNKHESIRSAIGGAEENRENATIKKNAYEDRYHEVDDEERKNELAKKVARFERKIGQYNQQIALYERLELHFSETLIDLQILRDLNPPFTDNIAATIETFTEDLEEAEQLTNGLLNMVQDMHEEIIDWLDRLDASQERVEGLRSRYQQERSEEVAAVRARLDAKEEGSEKEEEEVESGQAISESNDDGEDENIEEMIE